MEWARAARLERDCAEARREQQAIRAAADADMLALRGRLASWEAVAADIQASLAFISERRDVDPGLTERVAALAADATQQRPQAA
jgi:hypothetical protein